MAFKARTTQEIYDAMIVEKQSNANLNALQPNIDDSQTLLSDLSDNSQVADWRLWVWLVATAQSTLESLWSIFKKEVQEIVDQSHYGTLPWWKNIVLEYQHGDSLVWADNKYKYDPVIVANRIIKKSASDEIPGTVVIKVAKDGGVPLNAAELASFTQYCNLIKSPGLSVNIISDVPDDMKMTANIYYDPLVMAADGSLLSDASVFPVQDAIESYLANIDFDGELVITDLQDEMQLAEGVVNPDVLIVQTRHGATLYAPVVVKKKAFSGHFEVDSSVPYSSQLTYIANV